MTSVLSPEHAENLGRLLAEDRLILFVGAGISHQAPAKDGSSRRLPLWNQLADNVSAALSIPQKEYANNLLDLFDYINYARGRNILEEKVREQLRGQDYNLSDAHKELAKLPWHAVYTTNYDDLLQTALDRPDPIESDTDYERLASTNLKRPPLIHMHGTTRNFRTLTGADFADWGRRNELPYTYLKQFALAKAFLFVGYSFSDPHMSRGLIPWLHEIREGRNFRNYAWMWQVSEEQRRLLDNRDKIEAISIDADSDWAKAFGELSISCDAMKSSKTKPRLSTVVAGRDARASTDYISVNSYKLFYHRTKKLIDHARLAKASGMPASELRRLEKVSSRERGSMVRFPQTTRGNVAAIEKALGCVGKLEAGQEDDLLAAYVMYYKANRGAVGKRSRQELLDFEKAERETKAVVFDFGGTLTLSSGLKSTWERIWASAGYGINDAGLLHEDFVHGMITHQNWCDLTCEKLKARGFSRAHLQRIIGEVKPIPGLFDTFAELNRRGVPIYITSGSIRDIIIHILGDAIKFVHEIKANEMIFDDKDIIERIWGTSFDFEGKSTFIQRVASERRCDPIDVLFVGNNLNDHWASKSGARTLCVNPGETDYSNTLIWTHRIKEMTNLAEIFEFV